MPDERPIRLNDLQPVLAVHDLLASLAYWQTLGFRTAWVWGDPPRIGQVSRDAVGVDLEHNPALAVSAEGRGVLINVQNIEALYAEHQNANAQILVPLGVSEFGSREYTVRELNGYHLRFSAPPAPPVSQSKTLPASVEIVERLPTLDEFLDLSNSVGWKHANREGAARKIAAVHTAWVAQEIGTGKAVGSVFLVTVGAFDFYIDFVMVHPDWQGQRIGTTLLQTLLRWLQENALENAHLFLHTDVDAIGPFYESLGFTPHFGMSLRIKR